MSKDKHKSYQWIDGETADRITSMNLKGYRAYLKKEIREWNMAQQIKQHFGVEE